MDAHERDVRLYGKCGRCLSDDPQDSCIGLSDAEAEVRRFESAQS